MKNSFVFISLLSFMFSISLQANDEAKPFIIGRLGCQMGNNFFQLAAISAHAWDNDAEAYFPDLNTKQTEGMPINYRHVFFRFNANPAPGPTNYSWTFPLESNFSSIKLPYKPNMVLSAGTYHSENYFKHHREKLLQLFAPREDDLAYIEEKYAEIFEHPLTVGVQIRWFGCKGDEAWSDPLVQYGYDYYHKAMSVFPEDTLFVISTNDLDFAKENLPIDDKNIFFLENEPHYIDFFILSKCKHNIISNSSFGWWAAWLNQNEDKLVIAPKHWIDPKWHHYTPVTDVWPATWLKINAKWGKPYDPINSFK